jgi:hypothetical protein
MLGEDAGWTDGDSPASPADPGLDDIDMPPACIMTDAKAVPASEPTRGPHPTLGFAGDLGIDTYLGERLLDNLPQSDGGHAPRPIAWARPPDTREAASAMVSSAR